MNVLMLSTARFWSAPRNIARALSLAGAKVWVVTPRNSDIVHSDFIAGHVLYDREKWRRQLPRAFELCVEKMRPDSVLAADDNAFRALVGLRRAGRLAMLQPALQHSIPEDADVDRFVSDLGFLENFSDLPCAPPPFIRRPDRTAAQAFAQTHGFPVIAKRDGLSSGEGIHCLASEADLDRFLSMVAADQDFALEKFIQGSTVGSVVCGHAGRALACFAFAKVETITEFGPASVIRAFRHPEIEQTAMAVFERAGLSGFAGVDFRLDDAGKGWLLELNPRMTPATHLGVLFGVDIVDAWLKSVTDGRLENVLYRHQRATKVALFPDEIKRDPLSPHLFDGFHDVPWDDPRLLAKMMAELTTR